MRKLFLILPIALMLVACNGRQPKGTVTSNNTSKTTIVVPQFNADTAYQYVAKQTAFGPRVPETSAHAQCAAWLSGKLSEYADTVIVQEFRTRLFNGKGIDGKNIVAVFNPEAKKRIVLCSHWDSRPFADHDADEANRHTPIDGANDGASGVGVLLECARQFKSQPLNEKLGIDIVLFDLEDYGPHQEQAMEYYDENINYWALGSQYWSKYPHVYGYKAYYGILLDMVGGSNPNFQKEYYSQGFAAWVGNKVWRKAHDLGYRSYFSNELGTMISDDHIPMNVVAGIPTIDIIDLQPNSSNECFPEVWHTLNDNIQHIDKKTLGMVGDVLLHVIYEE
ncbi:MAG: M28 family peptidase [Bacteroidales bacterium]|nr:M28 family peptidase [Bacteroidales bacterium]